MKFEKLLQLLKGEAIFSSSILLAGNVSVHTIRRQLMRWVANGKLIQVRRGLYAVARPYKETQPHPFLVANMMKGASYVSLQSALEHYGIIPEYVPVITSVTTKRTEVITNKLGMFKFNHIKKELFWGYKEIEVLDRTKIFIASPEKGLLDLIYLTPQSDGIEYLQELRMQNTDKINIGVLRDYAKKFKTPKINRAAENIIKLLGE
jgi:predicted transcriptional regulator of viral defense system